MIPSAAAWRYNAFYFQWGRKLSLVTLTFDLNIQTHPSEGSNTSSMWIWRKSVQRFQSYFIHKQTKESQTAPKTEPFLETVVIKTRNSWLNVLENLNRRNVQFQLVCMTVMCKWGNWGKSIREIPTGDKYHLFLRITQQKTLCKGW